MDKRNRFLKFLAAHNVLIPFINNLDLEELPNLFQNKPDYWIVMAFKWDKTPEGYNYWAILDNCWLKICSIL